MAWVDANTKLVFPAVLNLENGGTGGFADRVSMTVHYKRNGVEYTDYGKFGYFSTTSSGYLCFVSTTPRVQYDTRNGKGGWGRWVSSSQWEEGLDELVYLTCEIDPTTDAVSNARLNEFIAMGAYWENEVEEETTDIKPVYLRKNGEWVKQNAYQMTDGEWVQISYAN